MTEPTEGDGKQALDDAIARAQTGDFSGWDTIREALESPDTEVRTAAAGACERIGFSAAVELLSRMATSDRDTDARNQAIYALVAVGKPAVVPVLIAVLEDEEHERRQDSRTALYRVLGKDVFSVLADEDGGPDPDPEESGRVTRWWQSRKDRYQADRVYAFGELASPAVFIEEVKKVPVPLPDAHLNALRDWTGQDFGQTPIRKVIQKWEKWWAEHRDRYEPGRRYFYGHSVP
jgi:hypothetical protein